MVNIRKETQADIPGIRNVNDRAFGQSLEGRIVDRLRQAGKLKLSLVAEERGNIIGQIAFSPVAIENNPKALPILGLGPMAVLPKFQKQGVGGKLVKKGLGLCQQAGAQAIVVLGHPGYYPRFGFVPSFPYNIAWEIDCPKEAFMVLGLEEGALGKISGKVKYDRAFMAG